MFIIVAEINHHKRKILKSFAGALKEVEKITKTNVLHYVHGYVKKIEGKDIEIFIM